MTAKIVMATNTTRSGISTPSSQPIHAERPSAPSTVTSAGVKQQMAVTTVPAMPIFRSVLRLMSWPGVATAALCLALAGCGSSSNQYTRDGSGNITIHCDQSELRWNACYDRAARLCGEQGYQIVRDTQGGVPTTTTTTYEVPVIGDSIVIRCGSQ